MRSLAVIFTSVLCFLSISAAAGIEFTKKLDGRVGFCPPVDVPLAFTKYYRIADARLTGDAAEFTVQLVVCDNDSWVADPMPAGEPAMMYKEFALIVLDEETVRPLATIELGDLLVNGRQNVRMPITDEMRAARRLDVFLRAIRQAWVTDHYESEYQSFGSYTLTITP